MSTKYKGLPDIDKAPDIFETSDEPEQLLQPSDTISDEDAPKKVTEGIDINGLPDRTKAQQVFGRRPQRNRQQYHLPPLQTHTLESDSETEDERKLESTTAKLRRLKLELAQVEAEIAAGPSTGSGSGSGKKDKGGRKSVLPPKPAFDLAGELSGLKDRLGAIEDIEPGQGAVKQQDEDEWTARLQRLRSGKTIKDEGGTASGRDESSHEAGGSYSVSDLDKRLARLETALGPDEMNTPLLPSLAKTDHLLSLLTQPRHLDAISRRVKLLLVDLDRAATASRRTATSATPNLPSSPEKQPPSALTLSQIEYSQLQNLFNILPRLDPILPILDPLLTRLKSLQNLHNESGEIAEGLRKLQSGQKEQEDEAKEMSAVVEEVQKGIGEAVVGIERNWKSLEARLGELDKRIKDLDA